MSYNTDLEHKFARLMRDKTRDPMVIEGYASLFGEIDQGRDIVQRGAYASSLARLAAKGQDIKMLWQHDPAQPIGVWQEVYEDDKGLYVKGRLLDNVARAQEAAALIDAGAIDGLSIGYRTVKSTKNDKGHRLLSELELWEVSLVTFPMLPSARVASKSEDRTLAGHWRALAEVLRSAAKEMAQF